MKVLILGMGNPILTDDGVGLVMADNIQKKVEGADVAVNTMIGMELLDQVVGYDRIFIIDAMTSSGGAVGDMRIITETNGYGSLHLFSSHGHNIFDLMKLGRECGLHIPELSAVYGIEIGDEVAFGEDFTPALQARLDNLECEILQDMTMREQSLTLKKAAARD
jgi:hydrogenase maturation protease